MILLVVFAIRGIDSPGEVLLLADREQDFSQEIFVSPISRYSIILGKILGESLVALPQALGIIAFGFILQIHIGPDQLARMALAMLVIALFGGAFGVIVLANLSSQRAANQIFPFVMLPQFFLAGIFNPIQNLPLPLDILSHLAPMRYAVDLIRDAYYGSTSPVVLSSATTNLLIIGALFVVFMVLGTFLFVRAERNR